MSSLLRYYITIEPPIKRILQNIVYLVYISVNLFPASDRADLNVQRFHCILTRPCFCRLIRPSIRSPEVRILLFLGFVVITRSPSLCLLLELRGKGVYIS